MKHSRIFLESSESKERGYDNNHVSRRNRTRKVIDYANGSLSPEKLEMGQITLLHFDILMHCTLMIASSNKFSSLGLPSFN